MVTVKLYIEGGGDSRLQSEVFREGWAQFFTRAGLRHRPRVIRGKGRNQTWDLYCRSLRASSPDTLNLLLVDSEDLPDSGHSAWQHLAFRDGWKRPSDAGDDDAFLMISCMEAWLIADNRAMHAFFGPKFLPSKIPAWPDLEKVPRYNLMDVLQKATGNCSKSYAKGDVSFQLLAQISPAEVERRCPAAKILLDRLRDVLGRA